MLRQQKSCLDMDLINAIPITGASPDERSYYDLWQSNLASPMDMATLTFAGGMLSDRLAWVFAAGYQVAMRRAFSLQGNRWSAFCVSEGGQGRPAVSFAESASGRVTLQGAKTWVAAASVVDELIVKVGRGHSAVYVKVDRDRPGLLIDIPEQDEFLTELHKGVAVFDGVVIADRDVLVMPPMKLFPLYEAGAILLAFTGLLYRLGVSDGLMLANTYAEDIMQADLLANISLLDSFLTELEKVTAEHAGELTETLSGWQVDQKLLTMYAGLIRRKSQDISA